MSFQVHCIYVNDEFLTCSTDVKLAQRIFDIALTMREFETDIITLVEESETL